MKIKFTTYFFLVVGITIHLKAQNLIVNGDLAVSGKMRSRYVDSNNGTYATALGSGNNAAGDYSVAAGLNCVSAGASSIAMGDGSVAGGLSGLAIGKSSSAWGDYSVALGYGASSTGTNSFAIGYYNTTSGDYTTALGQTATAQAYNSLVLGRYNITSTAYNKTSWVTTDPLFVIGNGTSTTPSNALTIYKSGDTEFRSKTSFFNGASATTPAIIIDPANSDIKINNQSVLKTDNYGNLGVGATSPGSRLSVSNNLATGYLNAYNKYQLLLYDGGTAATTSGIGTKTNTLVFNSSGGAYSFDAGGTQSRMVIDTTGKVGVGTSAPTSTLSVLGNMYVDVPAEGTLGIGNTPNRIFDVIGRTPYTVFNIRNQDNSFDTNGESANFRFALNDNTFKAAVGYYNRNANGRFTGSPAGEGGEFTTGSGNMYLYTNSTSTLYTFAANTAMLGGNVGIGTASPSEKLHVSGNIRASGVIRCAAGGDLSMGSFTSGTAP